jgi:glycosyltransferase involved in cell wall biosynthesis
MSQLRVLTFSSLFPSEVRPRHGIFVETRLLNLLRDCAVDARVIAPVPWFPLRAPMFGRYAQFAATPRRAVRNGLHVSHPRYWMLPKVGPRFQPDAMAHAAWGDVMALVRSGWMPDLIDAHYFYPDGVAAAALARRLDVPFVITARGSDVNLLGRQPGPAARMRDAARQAAKVITVSTRLKESVVAMGVDPGRVVVLRNGVDLDVFAPGDRAAARRGLALEDRPTLACVGNLVPEKGLELALHALARLEEAQLVLVGDGPSRRDLSELAAQLGIASRVRFVPTVAQRELRHLYAAADALLLTSTREGWPNVLLESLACGTPVVAVDVGAVREIVTAPVAGRVVQERDPALLAQAVRELLQSPPGREAVRGHAAGLGWGEVSRGQYEVFTEAVARHRAAEPLRADLQPTESRPW